MSDGLKNGRLPRFDERRDGPSSWLIKKNRKIWRAQDLANLPALRNTRKKAGFVRFIIGSIMHYMYHMYYIYIYISHRIHVWYIC